MKTNQSKTMKTNKLLKLIPVMGILALCTTQAQAQSTATSTNVQQAGTAIKVVDNKGTIKYFQSNNGITQITSTLAGSLTTTTWQLGGTLTDDTYIDATGKAFGLKGIPETALAAATVAGGAGYSLMVRNEQTGKVEALLASSLISGGVYEVVVGTDQAAGVFVTAAIPGLTTVSNRISVFRNGVKLRQTGTSDWALSAGTIDFTSDSGVFYTGDIIEVQWVK